MAAVAGAAAIATLAAGQGECERARAAPPAKTAAADHPACAVHGQPANGQLRIGTHTRSTVRACRPYDLRYQRGAARHPGMSDLWWSLGQPDNVLDVALDQPFVARRLAFDLYGWFRGDASLCRGSIEVAINGSPAGTVRVENGCTGRAEQNFWRSEILDLDRPTVIRSLRLTDRVGAPGARAGYILLERITLVTAPAIEPAVASVVDVWAEVHEPPPGIPGPGLWVVRPGKRPRKLAGPLPSESGNEVAVWEVPRSSQVFLAEPNGPLARRRELYTLDAASDDRPRRIRRFERDILDAWYDDCVAALVVELVDHATVLAFADGRAHPAACE